MALFLLGITTCSTYAPATNALLITVVSPIHYLANLPNNCFNVLKRDIMGRRVLIQENKKLKQQKLLYEVKLQRLKALERENLKLRGLIKITKNTQEKFLVTKLLKINNGAFNQKIILDKGAKSGVYFKQLLFDEHGLAGRIVSVGYNNSIALLITDVMSAVPVQINRNGLRAIAVGSGNGVSLELIQVPETSDIKIGDLLVTSGLGAVFPEGYAVGTISSIKQTPGERFMKIVITPFAKVNRNRYFLLAFTKNNKNKK